MPSHQAPKVSITGRVSVILVVLYCVWRAVFKLVFALLQGKYPGWPARRVFLVSLLQQRPMLLPSTTRKIVPVSGSTIKRICRSNGLAHSSIEVKCGSTPNATLHFVTISPFAQRTIYYLHGGGYVAPITRGHVMFIIDCAKTVKANIVFLEYTLAPEAPYPSQLIQAAYGLRYLQQDNNEIVIGGDSAGGNLAMALMAHAIKPRSGVPKIKPWYASLLISPWVELSYSSPSFTSNSSTDYLGTSIMQTVTSDWNPKHEVWADPLSADSSFWKTLPVERALVVAGGAEVFVDDDIKLAGKMGADKLGSNSQVELAVAEGEVHVQCILDATQKLPHGHMATAVIKWLSSI